MSQFKMKLVSGILLSLGFGVAFASEPPVQFTGPFKIGYMDTNQIIEASGLAPSRRSAEVLWTHNDSGGLPVLYAVSALDASLRGKLRLANVGNNDWEDVDSFELDGQPWLVAADVGDNLARRFLVVLHVVQEPDLKQLDPKKEFTLPPAYSIYFTYEDGPRDCESVAVDPAARAVYLLSKRDPVPQLYRLPLNPTTKVHPATARIIGKVPHLPRPNHWQKAIPLPTGAFRGEPTAMAFSSDLTLGLVLTYGDVLLFPRTANQEWAEAFAHEPIQLPHHKLLQAEGACFSVDGLHVYVVSEGIQHLVRYDRK